MSKHKGMKIEHRAESGSRLRISSWIRPIYSYGSLEGHIAQRIRLPFHQITRRMIVLYPATRLDSTDCNTNGWVIAQDGKREQEAPALPAAGVTAGVAVLLLLLPCVSQWCIIIRSSRASGYSQQPTKSGFLSASPPNNQFYDSVSAPPNQSELDQFEPLPLTHHTSNIRGQIGQSV